MNAIKIKNLDFSYKNNKVLSNINLTIEKNQKWALIGKNGAGKSTLIKIIAGFLKIPNGKLILLDQDISLCSAKIRSKIVAYVPQNLEIIIPYTVFDFVMLARFRSMGIFGIPSCEDINIVNEALELCDITHVKNRLMNSLSGGEIQRAVLAGAVAQQTPILLLDEPTTFLDPYHQRQFFDAIERIKSTRELTMLMITHDINTAMSQCSHVAAIVDGKIFFSGTKEKFKGLCPKILFEIFGIDFDCYKCENKNTYIFGAWN
jgi:iron complex transport system ATP-binding protein